MTSRPGTVTCWTSPGARSRLRKAHPALRRGRFETLYAHEDVVIFGRQVEGDAVVIAFNAGRETQNITCAVDDYLPDGALTDVWGWAAGARFARHAAPPGAAPAQRGGVCARVKIRSTGPKSAADVRGSTRICTGFCFDP